MGLIFSLIKSLLKFQNCLACHINSPFFRNWSLILASVDFLHAIGLQVLCLFVLGMYVICFNEKSTLIMKFTPAVFTTRKIFPSELHTQDVLLIKVKKKKKRELIHIKQINDCLFSLQQLK